MDATLFSSAVIFNEGELSSFPDTGFSVSAARIFTKLPKQTGTKKSISEGTEEEQKDYAYVNRHFTNEEAKLQTLARTSYRGYKET